MPGVPLDPAATANGNGVAEAGKKVEDLKKPLSAIVGGSGQGNKETKTEQRNKKPGTKEVVGPDGETILKEPINTFYLVKIPRPDSGDVNSSAVKILESRVADRQQRIEYLNAAMRVKQVSKREAHVHTVAALEVLKTHSAEIKAKFEVLKPLQEKLRAQQDQASSVRTAQRELEVTSEAELDAAVDALEYRIAHESLTLHEEKALVKKIKLLKQSRSTVKEFSSKQASVAESRNLVGDIRSQVKVVKEEVDLLKLQENMQREIFKKYQEDEKEIESAVKAIIAERNEVNAERDSIRDEIRGIRNTVRKDEDEYHRNRRLLKKMRDAVEAKDFDTCKEVQEEQLTRIHAKLVDEEYRKEHLRLLAKQNPRRYLLAEVDEEAAAAGVTSVREAEAYSAEKAREKAKEFIKNLVAAPAPAAPEPEPEPEPAPEPEPEPEPVKGEKVKPVKKKKVAAPVVMKTAAPKTKKGKEANAVPSELLEAMKESDEVTAKVELEMEKEAPKMSVAEKRKASEAKKKAAAQKAEEDAAAAEAKKKAAKAAKKQRAAEAKKQRAAEPEVEEAAPVVEEAAPVEEVGPAGNEEKAVATAEDKVVKAEKTKRRRVVKKGKVVLQEAGQKDNKEQFMMATVVMLVLIFLVLCYMIYIYSSS
mmetsp:Transcript_42513/g.51622  ORF Transcript_42513/g.51622 Transcript_42513/m.51622 type:complete len:647 (-) Transcript_42513:493-2433(-)|eukprot:CAMPEP_0197847714 /NCGR_PEP_ID=MMETSP1438-20131217/6886_1 /TAXON_ID=1461541 /ORGANISM="Pterosperma sp., Strain CCMP1384" /LENGTH=646 /DNA_ID=CAMNT_0043459719 /DNA_START=138 /DNA_END=2078 /DNA_ORIENTATION=+